MCGGRSSILHYGPLIETNYLYAPTPNGQKPECVAKQTQYPPLQNCPLIECNSNTARTHWMFSMLKKYFGDKIIFYKTPDWLYLSNLIIFWLPL